MPGSFPVLSTGASFRYPVQRKISPRAVVNRFCDFSEQTYLQGNGNPLTEFTFVWSSISTADKNLIRDFYDTQNGEEKQDWSLVFDNVLYSDCQFVGDCDPACIGPKLWSVTLTVRVGASVRIGNPRNASGSPIASANLIVIASFTTDPASPDGRPSVEGLYGGTSGFPIGGAIGSSPTTLTYAIPTADLGNFYNLGVQASIIGTLGGAVFTAHRSTLNIYDVQVQATYQDGTTGIVRPGAYSSVTGFGYGIFYGGPQGNVLNPGAAFDTDPSTFASVTRDFYGPLADAGYLQLSSFQFPLPPAA